MVDWTLSSIHFATTIPQVDGNLSGLGFSMDHQNWGVPILRQSKPVIFCIPLFIYIYIYIQHSSLTQGPQKWICPILYPIIFHYIPLYFIISHLNTSYYIYTHIFPSKPIISLSVPIYSIAIESWQLRSCPHDQVGSVGALGCVNTVVAALLGQRGSSTQGIGENCEDRVVEIQLNDGNLLDIPWRILGIYGS